MPTLPPRMLLAVANVLLPVAVLIFATGFFPYKPFIQGLAQYKMLEHGPPPKAQFDKVIFMVVDALRSDFVYTDHSGFAFTQQLIRTGEAIPFTAHATPPTITMPRVKAITTGSIPSFLDVILNFAESDTTSSLAGQDTWLAQIKANGGKLVMYGDDTWLKLFPHTFSRADGTSSFFVSDFTEVDNNVTRHVSDELLSHDWDAWIMHYLGLDHIGHKTGPNGPHMIPKQQEMDGIVRQIYDAMTRESHLSSTLFILCGDHGMNDGGNHGGSAPGETSPALVFMSPKLKAVREIRQCPTKAMRDFDFYTKIEQSDIAPTIAGLLGFPVPLNNLGVFIQDFLPLWTDPTDQIQLLLRNALQMLDIVRVTFPGEDFDSDTIHLSCENSPSAGSELACRWREAKAELENNGISDLLADSTVASLYKFCRKAQEVMSSAASNYNISRLLTGIAFGAISALLAFSAFRSHVNFLTAGGLLFLATLILYGVMMFASSYVEEEQHFWYWITSCWFAVLLAMSARRSRQTIADYLAWILFLSLHRIAERWNQTGQKYAGAPDIVHTVLEPMPLLLWILVFATYAVITCRIAYHFPGVAGVGSLLAVVNAIALHIPSVAFKLSFTANDAPELLAWLDRKSIASLQQVPLVATARIVFFQLAAELPMALVARFFFRRRHQRKADTLALFQDLLTFLLIAQTRAHNIPLYLIFLTQHAFLQQLRLSTTQVAFTTILLAHVSFFALGNSNAISSIDLSNAYNGVSGYNVVAVGFLVFVGNWAGPIWWSVAGMQLLKSGSDGRPRHGSGWNGKTLSKRAHPQREWISEEHRHLSESVSADATFATIPQQPISSSLLVYLVLWTLFVSTSLLAVMLSCTILRTHLFIWTVFSPKYLYAMAWTLGFHLLITAGLASAVWKVGSD